MFLCVIAFPSTLAGGIGGQDTVPADSEVPFSIIERTAPSQDGVKWSLEISMDDEAINNGTTFILTTQICLNSGVCDPPVTHDVDAVDGHYTVSVTPPDTHTYVNWRVRAVYSDNTKEDFPNGDWYKTWSTCWYNDGEYGGIHSTENGCDVPAQGSAEDEGFLPASSLILTMMVLHLAVIVRRQRTN